MRRGGLLGTAGDRLFESAMALNRRNILQLLIPKPTARLLDLGCDDGHWTAELGVQIGTDRLYGIEIVKERACEARSQGIHVTVADLSRPLPFEDASMGIVHSNQVIEHLPDIDLFVSEAYRVLHPGGYTLVSTENASSWHNIGAAVMGWQIFSATNVSKLSGGLGNPLALHRGTTDDRASWTHKTVLNYRGLIELFQVHGFKRIRVLGAGYHPLPPRVGKVDVRHAHFLALRASRP